MVANERETLDWVNLIRREHGLEALEELAVGVRGAVYQCVISRSVRFGSPLTVTAGMGWVTTREPGGPVRSHRMPPEVQEFLDLFDKGRVYHLIDRAA